MELLTALSPAVFQDDLLWRSTHALVDAAPTVRELQWHRLHLLAAERWRAANRDIPDEVAQAERLAGIRLTAAPMLLERIRAVYDGRYALIKGYEVAVR